MQLYNLMVRDSGGHGVVIASFYLQRHDAVTVKAALQYIITWLFTTHAVVWDVKVSMQDDSPVEKNAVLAVWPRAQIRLCVWHIVHRNVQSKCTGYFGLDFSLFVVGKMWSWVRQGGHRDHRQPVEIVCEYVDILVDKLGKDMPQFDRGSKYHPESVKERLRKGM
jgi:hypothetical protein